MNAYNFVLNTTYLIIIPDPHITIKVYYNVLITAYSLMKLDKDL